MWPPFRRTRPVFLWTPAAPLVWPIGSVLSIVGFGFLQSCKSVWNTKRTSLGAFAKLRKATINFVMSVRPHGTTRLPLERLSWNLRFWVFFENMSRKIKFRLCFLIVMHVLSSTLTEGFPCFFLSCKANARVYFAKTGHGPHCSVIVLFHVLIVLFCVLFYVDCVVLCIVCVSATGCQPNCS